MRLILLALLLACAFPVQAQDMPTSDMQSAPPGQGNESVRDRDPPVLYARGMDDVDAHANAYDLRAWAPLVGLIALVLGGILFGGDALEHALWKWKRVKIARLHGLPARAADHAGPYEAMAYSLQEPHDVNPFPPLQWRPEDALRIRRLAHDPPTTTPAAAPHRPD